MVVASGKTSRKLLGCGNSSLDGKFVCSCHTPSRTKMLAPLNRDTTRLTTVHDERERGDDLHCGAVQMAVGDGGNG